MVILEHNWDLKKASLRWPLETWAC